MTRRHLVFIIACTALAGSLVAAWGTIRQRNYNLRGYIDPTRGGDLPFKIPLLGINADLTQYDAQALDSNLELMRDAHITWVRQSFPWDRIEPAEGKFDWDSWDLVVNAIDQHPDLTLVAVLQNTPAWARTSQSPHDLTAPPATPSTFVNFARQFADRYGTRIDYYQIWDEPNLTDSWGGLPPRPAAYIALLTESYRAIHSVDSRATVIAAALAPTMETGPENISDIEYLRDLYALGLRDVSDAIAAKPYGFNTSPFDRIVDENWLNFSRIVALREEMVRNNDGGKALWASNWGWNSLPEDWSDSPSIWGQVTQDQQSSNTLAALTRAEREWPWLGGMILQHWQPEAPPDDPIWGFALVDQDNNPTPLFQSLIERSHDDIAVDGLYHVQNPYTEFSGVWTFSDLGADIGWLQDSQLAFHFGGTAISLLLRQDDFAAYLYPTIDNQQPDTLPLDPDGTAYIVLTSDSLDPELELVSIADNLSQQEHTLHLVADRGFDRWVFAGFAVSSGNLAAPYNRQFVIALITASIAGMGLIRTGWQMNWDKLTGTVRNYWNRFSGHAKTAIGIGTSLALLVGMILTWNSSTPNLIRREPIQLVLAVITAGVIYLQPGFILTIIALAMLFFIILDRIEIGLMLTVFWAPFFLFPIELYHFAFPMAEIMILVTTSAYFFRLSILATAVKFDQNIARIVNTFSAIDYAILLWLVLGFVSLTWANHPSVAFDELRTLIFEPALFYVILRTTVKHRRSVICLVYALIVAGTLVAIISLIQYAQSDSIITAEDGARRLAGIYGSPNNLSLFLGRVIPITLAQAMLSPDRANRIFSTIALALMGMTVILSQSAGAIFLGVPSAIITILIVIYGKKAWWIVAGILTGLFSAIVIALQFARFSRLLDFSTGTTFIRLRVWQSTINILKDHPIEGLGLDQFLYAFRGRYIMPDAWQEPNLSHPHNILLDVWVRLGLGGVFLLFMIQAEFWKSVIKLTQLYRNHDQQLLAIVVGFMGTMVNLVIHGLVDNSIFVMDLVYVFMLILGISATLSIRELVTDTEKIRDSTGEKSTMP